MVIASFQHFAYAEALKSAIYNLSTHDDYGNMIRGFNEGRTHSAVALQECRRDGSTFVAGDVELECGQMGVET